LTEIDQPEAHSAGASTLRIEADVHHLATVRQFIREQARKAGADERAMSDLVQAVDESVSNSIVHGYRGAPGTVEIEAARDGSSLVVRLRDQAPPFDPTRVPIPDTSRPLHQQRLGGLGVLLTRELTDSMTYRYTNRTNELTLTKKLRSA
jgi:serine/threonine-protein kinase RsbW